MYRIRDYVTSDTLKQIYLSIACPHPPVLNILNILNVPYGEGRIKLLHSLFEVHKKKTYV